MEKTKKPVHGAAFDQTAPLGIASALMEELHGLLSKLSGSRTHTIGNRVFWSGRIGHQEVVLVLSRVGKVAAAATATALIVEFGVRAVVFAGVAGGIGNDVRIGDMVIAQSLLQHDVDASPMFARWEVPLTGLSRFRADEQMVDELTAHATAATARIHTFVSASTLARFHMHAPRVHVGLVVSGDRFVSSMADACAMKADLPDALAVEMEGAAIAQVCHEWSVPFAVIRAISDKADDDASGDFSRFLSEVGSQYTVQIIDAWLGDRRRFGSGTQNHA